MKKCAIIACYANNQFRKELLQSQIKFFNELNIDVILVSSDHIEKMDGVKNYITINHVSDKKYLTEGIFQYSKIEGFKYYSNAPYSNISASNFFIKLFQCSFAYCNNLGYDFCYGLDFDNIISKSHVPVAFSDNLDFTKVYFYNYNHPKEYHGVFFYGNLKVLSEIYSDKNLEKLENVAKKDFVYTNEEAYFILANQFAENIIVLPHGPDNLFSKINMFSSRNTANVYYNQETKEYWFLQYKGDSCENEFACELFLDDVLIYSNHLKHTGLWYLIKLENNRNYKIKYYDAAISELTLSKTLNIYTDTNTVTTSNWIQRT